MKIRKTTMLFAAIFATCCIHAEIWHSQLYLDGGRPHLKRVEVTFENKTGKALDGQLSYISAKELGIVGRPSKELRVVSENGKELLFALEPESEIISEGAKLAIPVDCEPGKKSRAWVYFDNPKAWELPSNLKSGPVDETLDFESLKSLPVPNWSDNSQKNYYNKLEENSGREGGKCVSTTAEKGSKPEWVCISRQFPVGPGDKYKISGWVKGENVDGRAGFYIHVGSKNFLHKDNNKGTFGWKKVDFEGTIPEGVNYLSFGTVLYAKEGKAWFDDMSVKIERSQGAAQVSIGKVESLEFAKTGESSQWHISKAQYPSRIVLSSFNFSQERKKNSLVVIPINRITNANYDAESFAAFVDNKQVPFLLASGNMVLEIGDIPPHSEKVFYVYLNKDKKNQTVQAKAKQASGILSDYETQISSSASAKDFEKLMNSPVNLYKNSSFEENGNSWSTAEGKDVDIKFVDGGLFGKRAAMLDIKDTAPKGWYGLRQGVPTEPMSGYMIIGWVKCPDGGGSVNAHYTPKGSTFESYSAAISGKDWQMFSMYIPSRSEGNVSVHLTATSGKYFYDGIIAAQCVNASLVGFESASDAKEKDFSVWQVDNLIKIFTGDVQSSDAEPYLELAGNEYEGMQLGIRSSSEIKDLEVSASAPVYDDSMPILQRAKILFGIQDRPTLPAPQIGNIGNVGIDTESRYFHFTDLKPYERFVPPNNFGVMYPDPILPFAKFDLAAKTTKGVYLIFNAPKNAQSGIYSGNIELKAGGKVLKSIPYKIRVYDFSLSDEPQLYAIFDVRMGAGAKYKSHTMHDAAKFMRSKKLSVDTIPARIDFKLVDGKPVADFSKFDEEAEFYLNELKFPYLYLPFRYGTFGWANPPAPYLGENPYPGKWPYESADHAVLNPKYREYLVESLKQIAKHLEEKGWSDRFMFYISDEPFANLKNIEKQMIALCDAIHEGAPKIKIYCSTWYYVPQWLGKLNIWGVGAQGQASVDDIETIKKSGAEIITTTDGQFVLDNPYNALERLLPLYCYKYGFKGYEFWGADWYTVTPLKWGLHMDIPQSDTPGKHYRVRYPNGDGYIFYPGKLIGQTQPFSSVRMESHRDGVEDYEYFVMLEKLAKAKNDKPALDTLERIKEMAFIPNAGGRNAVMLLPNPEEYTKLRAEIARHIERLK